MSGDDIFRPDASRISEKASLQKEVPVKDASSLLIIDRQANPPTVLMGRRNARLIFMPGMYVFPGGSSDKEDAKIIAINNLNRVDEKKLLAGMGKNASPRHAKALALCAIRETFEETGLRLAVAAQQGELQAQNANTRINPYSSHPSWQDFMAGGFIPDLQNLRYFARAITPPRFNRRFDTRFFIIFRDQIYQGFDQALISCGELEELGWIALKKASSLNIADITALILSDACKLLKNADYDLPNSLPVAQYYSRSGRLIREVI